MLLQTQILRFVVKLVYVQYNLLLRSHPLLDHRDFFDGFNFVTNNFVLSSKSCLFFPLLLPSIYLVDHWFCHDLAIRKTLSHMESGFFITIFATWFRMPTNLIRTNQVAQFCFFILIWKACMNNIIDPCVAYSSLGNLNNLCALSIQIN